MSALRVEQLLADGRSVAATLMTDSCIVTRGDNTPVLDPATGRYVTGAGETVYNGPCRVRQRSIQDAVVEAGGAAISLWQHVVQVPVSVTDVRIEDTVTVTAISGFGDQSLIGVPLRVRTTISGSQITARRLICEERE
jgi:hypothetical protein